MAHTRDEACAHTTRQLVPDALLPYRAQYEGKVQLHACMLWQSLLYSSGGLGLWRLQLIQIQDDQVFRIRRLQMEAANLADEDYVLNYISSLNHNIKISQSPSTLLLVEDLVVGLLVDSIGDLLVVLVAEASLVSGVVNLYVYISIDQ